jgi:hypothetical protein
LYRWHNFPAMTLESIVQALKQEKQRIEIAISALEGVTRKATKGGRRQAGQETGNRRRKKRRMSAESRKRISEAAKARWAKAKKAGKNTL